VYGGVFVCLLFTSDLYLAFFTLQNKQFAYGSRWPVKVEMNSETQRAAAITAC
jgi:hypothetical protein